MQTPNAHSYLAQFNTTIDKWIGFLQGYSIEMLCQRPNDQSWSLAQVYVHIIQDTTFYIDQMRAALLTSADSEKTMHHAAKTMLENNAFPDMQLENPANSLNLRQPLSKQELLHGLLVIKEEVSRLCTVFDIEKSTGKTEHPGFLFLNAVQWLRLAEMHIRHHLAQKNRIDEALGLFKKMQ